MKKRNVAALAALTLFLGVYIGTRTGSVSGMTKNDLTLRAKNFVRRLNRRDYEACESAFGSDMQVGLDADRLRETFDPALDTLGDFVKFRTTSFSRPDKLDGYVLCTLKCEYEKKQAAFLLLFNGEGEICGLQLK